MAVDLDFRLSKQESSAPVPAATWDVAEVRRSFPIAPGYFRIELVASSIATAAQPGQFVMLNFPDVRKRLTLPRPMAIHRRHPEAGTIEVIMKIQGAGTQQLSEVQAGEALLVTGPLGRGFHAPSTPGRLLLLGRGIGVCSIMPSLEDAATQGIPVAVLLSARSADVVVGLDDCAALGAETFVVTDEDGSSDVESVRTLLLDRYRTELPTAVQVCGSTRLMKLAHELGALWGAGLVQASVESHMACGLGYCHGCEVPPIDGVAVGRDLVCVDGPVFDLIPL